jgi:hypothetical protein
VYTSSTGAHTRGSTQKRCTGEALYTLSCVSCVRPANRWVLTCGLNAGLSMPVDGAAEPLAPPLSSDSLGCSTARSVPSMAIHCDMLTGRSSRPGALGSRLAAAQGTRQTSRHSQRKTGLLCTCEQALASSHPTVQTRRCLYAPHSRGKSLWTCMSLSPMPTQRSA